MTDTYRDTIKQLSNRIVEAQRPIKVLKRDQLGRLDQGEVLRVGVQGTSGD